MAEEDKFHGGKPPVFDGNNYDYWKKKEWRFFTVQAKSSML
jgi:hypothetical protein